jgi:tRNA splicing endonuclease
MGIEGHSGKLRPGKSSGDKELHSVDGFFIVDDAELVEKLELLGAGVGEDGKRKLPLIEAAYFQEKGAIDTGKSVAELISGKEDEFAVLKQLRDSGRIVRIGEGESEFMRVYRKGIRVGEDRTEGIVKVLREGEKPDLLSDVAVAGKMRKELTYAFVGGDGITFVKAYRAGFE